MSVNIQSDSKEISEASKLKSNASIIPRDKLKESLKKEKDTIHKSAERGNVEAMKEFLKKKKSLCNARNDGGLTPLHIATLHSNYEVVELLIQSGCDVGLQDNSGWSALHFAASGQIEKTLRLLLDQPNIDVKVVNEGLNTPLHYLVKNFAAVSRSIIETFVNKGADINATNKQGETPLHGATLKGHEEMINMLLDFGANIDIATDSGETPLNWATKGGKEQIISVLLRAHSTKNFGHRKSITERPSELKSVLKTELTPQNIRYELTFLGTDTEVILNDDNWDACLYNGGMELENKTGVSTQSSDNPHYDAVRREDLPLSKLFHLYLSISGRNKTDPEIVYWITDFLSGVKKKYLLYLCENFSYRIRVKNAQSEKKPPHERLVRLIRNKRTQNYLNLEETPCDKDIKLWKSVFENPKFFEQLEDSHPLKNLIRMGNLIPWQISLQDIKIISKIGSGAYGVVYKAKWMGAEVAVKKSHTDNMNEEGFCSFLNEIAVISNLRHPNILMFLGASIRPPNLWSVAEFLVLGSLNYVLKTYTKLDWKVRLNMAIECARGLLYLHSQDPPILHRDLKSMNILVDKNFHIKVADFGISTKKSTKLNSKVGTLNWLAPEILNGSASVYLESADIYSFGMILWELVSGRIPYEGKNHLQILRMIDMHELESIPANTNPVYAELIRACWKSDPKNRPKISEVLDTLESIKEDMPGVKQS